MSSESNRASATPAPEAVEIVSRIRSMLMQKLGWPPVAISSYVNTKGVTRHCLCSDGPGEEGYEVWNRNYLLVVASSEESRQWHEDWGDFIPPHVVVDLTGDEDIDRLSIIAAAMVDFPKPKRFFVQGEAGEVK